MSSFRSFGGSDDAPVFMGDRAFLRLNQRLEPWQLADGELVESVNGRMDRGVWQPRKAIKRFSGSLSAGREPLRLPFFLADTPGGLAIDSAERVDQVVTLTITGHPFTVGGEAYLGVEGLTGTVDPNGVQLVTVVDADTLTFEIADAVGNETYGGSGVVRSVIDDAAASDVVASCLFSDPNAESAESVIVALTLGAVKVPLSGGSAVPLTYPLGVEVLAGANMLQAFDRVILFRDGERALEWVPGGKQITAAALSSNVVTVTVANHGLNAGDTVTIAGLGFSGTDPNGEVVVASTPTGDTFTFALTGGDESFTATSATIETGFTFVRGGVYTQPQVFSVTSTNVVVSDGEVTLTVSGNTTIAANDKIRIYGTDAPEFATLVGREFVVTSASATTIKFFAPVVDLSNIHSNTLEVGKPVSLGAGFGHMPAPPFGVYHQRRLIVPYRYSVGGTQLAPTYTERGVRDELVISDILDSDTYDLISNQFRITGGIADFIVGFWPFYEDVLLVFNRNSIHGLFGISGSLGDVAVRELTREIGCVARQSIAQHGSSIMFLSDSGVYAIQFIDEYNLRGAEVPLSEPIQPLIDRINPNLATEAVGVYFANRYYLAVPLDSVAGANDATGNNAILIYNFLNQGWESVDTVNDSKFSLLSFIIGRSGAKNDLYFVTKNGGVHQIDAVDTDFDEVDLGDNGEGPSLVGVSWNMKTRQYDGGTQDRKRFVRAQLQVESSVSASNANILFSTEDPDSSISLGNFVDRLGDQLAAQEEASLRVRIGGKRGHGGSIQVTNQAGRPKIKSVAIEATTTNRATTTQV